MKRLIKETICIITLSMLLFGCSAVSPKYTSPTVDVPMQWAHFSTEKISEITAEKNQSWWKNFHDDTLNKLVQVGLKYNNTVGQAQANIEQAEGQLKAIQYSWIPGFSLIGGYSNNPDVGSPFGFYGISVAYDISNLFHLAARQKSAEIAVAAQKEIMRGVKLNFVAQLSGGYYTYIATLKQLELYRRYQNDLVENLNIYQEDTAGKINSNITVKSASQEVDRAAAQQEIIMSNRTKSQNALRYLINKNPGKITSKVDFSTVTIDYSNFAMLPAAVLDQRPDVAIAALQYRLATQNKGLAYSQLLPQTKLFDFQGNSHVSDEKFSGSAQNFGDAYVTWTINPSIFGDIKRLRGAEKANYYHYTDTVRAALRDVDNALIDHEMANKTYQLTKQACHAAQQKYALVLPLYQAGIASYAELLQEKIMVDQALLALNQAKLRQILSAINLYQNLGLYAID